MMSKSSKKKTGILLTFAMIFAMIMGPGPGLRLVNPDMYDPNAVYTLMGVPVIYVWGLFWFFVQIIIILAAYRTVWNESSHLSK